MTRPIFIAFFSMFLILFISQFAYGEEGPLVLPDSDTSSLGIESLPEETPFMLRCTTAEEFNAMLKKTKAKGMIVGKDTFDKTLTMVFKSEAGSLVFARSDWKGKTVCVFGTLVEYDVDLGTVFDNNSGSSN